MSILIVYGSLLGKTKRLATILNDLLLKNSFNSIIKDVRECTPNELANYDLTIMMCSTWDDGMLQVDFRDFNKKLLRLHFSGRNFAIIGVGGHKYPHFCTSADILTQTVDSIGGIIIIRPLKLNLDHDDHDEKCDNELVEWSNELISKLQ